MKTLHLTLKKKWFDMIASGEKQEEYREIKPYWQRRFHNCTIQKYAGKVGDCQEVINLKVVWSFPCYKCDHSEKIKFNLIQFRHGYAKNAPIMTFKMNEIRVTTGFHEWGAEPGKKYFVIKLGERIA